MPINNLLHDSLKAGRELDALNKINETVTDLNRVSPLVLSGAGTPEGAVTAPVGTLYLRTNGGANTTLYIKESGAGNTGWVAK